MSLRTWIITALGGRPVGPRDAVEFYSAVIRAEICGMETRAAQAWKIGEETEDSKYLVQSGNMRGEAAKIKSMLAHFQDAEDVQALRRLARSVRGGEKQP